MNPKPNEQFGLKRRIRYWPPSLVHLSKWPPRADYYFANCYRSIFEQEILCTVELNKREIHWLHGVTMAQVSQAAVKRRLDAGGGASALLAMLVPALRHHGIVQGPLKVEFGKVMLQIPEMAGHFGEQTETVEEGIWLTPQWSPEASAARTREFERDRKARLMQRQIDKERREAARASERRADEQPYALRMNPVFD